MKFDYQLDESPLAFDLQSLAANRPVFVLGSTIEGEDEVLLPELEKLENVFIVIAPRKPERFDAAAGLLKNLQLVRRTELTANREPRTANCLLLDSVGELSRIYAFATVAFVGGSLVPTGGHNPIEPAAAGLPVCFGPHMTNFREIAAAFLDARGAVEVKSPDELYAFASRMLDDEFARRAYGDRARAVVEQNRGAAGRTAQRIIELLA